jgi:hypothetical protein
MLAYGVRVSTEFAGLCIASFLIDPSAVDISSWSERTNYSSHYEEITDDQEYG